MLFKRYADICYGFVHSGATTFPVNCRELQLRLCEPTLTKQQVREL